MERLNEIRNSAISIGIEAYRTNKDTNPNFFSKKGEGGGETNKQFIHIYNIINCNRCEFYKSQKLSGKRIWSSLIENCSVFFIWVLPLSIMIIKNYLSFFRYCPIAYWFKSKLEILLHREVIECKSHSMLKRYFWYNDSI